MAAFVPFLVFFMLSWQDHVRSSTVMLFSLENRNTAYTTLGLIAQMIRGFIVGNVSHWTDPRAHQHASHSGSLACPTSM